MAGSLAGAAVAGPAVTPADLARADARAMPVVQRFVAAVRRCGARPRFVPAVQVAAAPGIIHYDEAGRAIVIYPWSVVDAPLRADSARRAAAAGQFDGGREAYESVFNELLVAHELGHWLQSLGAEPRTADGRYDGWFAEQDANRIAVAFWREDAATPAAGAARLDGWIGPDPIGRNPMPPPTGTSLERFFTDNTMPIVRGGGYGWYQGLMARRAVAERPAPRFCALVSRWLPVGPQAAQSAR